MLVFLALTLCLSASAQQSPPLPETPQPQSTGPARPVQIPPVGLFVMLNRKSIVFPDIASNSQPLSPAGKFKLFVDNSISLHALAIGSLSAGVAQAADTPKGYGQGGDGYAKRFGASMARQASSNFFGNFLLASALHQDPRFFPKREASVGRSIGYSLERVVVTRNDDGRDVANWSGLMKFIAPGLVDETPHHLRAARVSRLHPAINCFCSSSRGTFFVSGTIVFTHRSCRHIMAAKNENT